MNMTAEMMEFKAVEEKLSKILRENNLEYTFCVNAYPIYLSVHQGECEAEQAVLFEVNDENISSKDACIRFIFQDAGIIITTDNRLVISDDLMTKIKGCAKKMHYLYLQAFFCEVMARKIFTEPIVDFREDEGIEDPEGIKALPGDPEPKKIAD